jgi:flagellar motor switch protein FliG
VVSSTSALFVALALTAAPAEPSVDEVRTRTRDLLSSMCGERCDVVAVRIERRPAAPAAGLEPGFDESPRAREVAAKVQLTLLFDAKLDAAYRKFAADRVKQRIEELGLPVELTVTARPFPEPPELPASATQPPPPPQAPIIIQPPPPAAPEPAPAPAPVKADLEEALWLRLIEALPLLLGMGLLAWLVLRVLGRMESLAFNAAAPGVAEEEVSATLTPELIEEPSTPRRAAPLPPPSREALAGELTRHRGSTRRIFHRLLVQGEHDTVARAVALLGDFVVQDLSHDPELRRQLAAAGQRTAEILRAPITDEEEQDLLRTVQAELVADRVAHRAEDVRRELEPLLGWGPEAFAALFERLDARLQVVLLRHAPGHLTESFLRGLLADDRAAMVRRVLDAPSAAPDELAELAEIIDAQGQAALVGGYEADHIVDLLDALPAPEQDTVVTTLESTRPEFVRRNLGALPVESALLRVPEHALEAAWATVSVEDWIAYLRAAPETIQRRALAACPARLVEAVEEELGVRVAVDPGRAAQARRRIVQAALRAGGA